MWQSFEQIASLLRLILAKQAQVLREVEENEKRILVLERGQKELSDKLDQLLQLIIPPPVAGFSVEVTINKPI